PAEMILPYPVDDDAGRQRVVRRRDPARQLGASAGGLRRRDDRVNRRRLFIQKRQIARFDRHRSALLGNESRRRDRTYVRHRQADGKRRWSRHAQRRELLAQGHQLLLVRVLQLAFQSRELVEHLAVGQLGELLLQRRTLGGRLVHHRLDFGRELGDGAGGGL